MLHRLCVRIDIRKTANIARNWRRRSDFLCKRSKTGLGLFQIPDLYSANDFPRLTAQVKVRCQEYCQRVGDLQSSTI